MQRTMIHRGQSSSSPRRPATKIGAAKKNRPTRIAAVGHRTGRAPLAAPPEGGRPPLGPECDALHDEPSVQLVDRKSLFHLHMLDPSNLR